MGVRICSHGTLRQEEMASNCAREGLGWASRGFLHGKGGQALELPREVFSEQLDIALRALVWLAGWGSVTGWTLIPESSSSPSDSMILCWSCAQRSLSLVPKLVHFFALQSLQHWQEMSYNVNSETKVLILYWDFLFFPFTNKKFSSIRPLVCGQELVPVTPVLLYWHIPP